MGRPTVTSRVSLRVSPTRMKVLPEVGAGALQTDFSPYVSLGIVTIMPGRRWRN